MKKQYEYIYFDNAATTKPISISNYAYTICPWGNPSSSHTIGKLAKQYILDNKQVILESVFKNSSTYNIDINQYDIAFTSGGTEADNLAILGQRYNNKKHIVVSCIEHKAILNACKELENHYGFEVTYVPVNSTGCINILQLLSSLREDTCLVSVMAVNNETGIDQPINAIARICKQRCILFHTDAVQSNLHGVYSEDIDMISLSGHKFGTHKGIGCLIYKKDVHMSPLIYGGGQQNGLISGTENVCGIEELAIVSKDVSDRLDSELANVLTSTDYILKALALENTQNIIVNSMGNGILNLYVKGIPSDALVLRLSDKGIFISNGSACNSEHIEPSYVLSSMGYDKDRILSSVRISLSWTTYTTIEELNRFCKVFIETIEELEAIF